MLLFFFTKIRMSIRDWSELDFCKVLDGLFDGFLFNTLLEFKFDWLALVT